MDGQVDGLGKSQAVIVLGEKGPVVRDGRAVGIECKGMNSVSAFEQADQEAAFQRTG